MWWRRWEVYVLLGLFTNKKWKKPGPNLEVGQICLIHEATGKHSSSTYKYCKVVEVTPDKDGLVRKVTVLYFNIPSLKAKRKEVNVRCLTVLPPARKVAAAKF